MLKKGMAFFLGLLLLIFTGSLPCQGQDQADRMLIKIKPSVDFEYFSRTVSWDEDEYTADLKIYLFKLNAEFEFQKGFYLSAFVGYSLSNYDSMTFKKLPISIELDVGEIGGILLGGALKKSILRSGDYEIDAGGEFVYNLGSEKNWSIPGLSVSGNVTGKASWMRAIIGPMVTYRGLDRLSPYVSINFNTFWGKFNMDQEIQDLTGNEEKKISGKSIFSGILGANYEISDTVGFNVQAELIPHSDGLNFGALIKLWFSL